MRNPADNEGAERLFYYNQIMVSTFSTGARYSSLGANSEHYLEWKSLYYFDEHTDFEPQTSQEILLCGLFNKRNLIDVISNFIVYEKNEKSKTIKKLCRYQQFRAVNKAIDRIKNNTGKKRSGVIWHTQGSGKSLTMVYLTIKLRREEALKTSTIVVVTDRVDLDKQIAGTFARAYGSEVYHSESVEDTKQLLRNVHGGVVVTTIFKFQENEKIKALTERDDIIVLVDEAHRSQYKDMAYIMRMSLPNAVYLGFTGTPISKQDKDTTQTFGSYIDTYPFNRAVEDGATVPIYYEARKPELMIEKADLDELFNETFCDYSDEQKELIKQKYVNKALFSEIPQRIDKICDDLIQHYRTSIEPNGYKAQVVASSQDSAVTYYEKLCEKLKGTGIETAIIISGTNNNDRMNIKQHTLSKKYQDNLIARFKNPEDTLKIIVVNNMLLTGFDAPVEGVMYIDRSLREHTLLQAVARVNRTYKNKICGLVVDYYGISKSLKEALEIFTDEDIESAIEDISELVSRLDEAHRKVRYYFRDLPKKSSFSNEAHYIEEIMLHFENEQKREEFYTHFRIFAKLYDAIMPNEAVTKYRPALKDYSKIYMALHNLYRNDDTPMDFRGIGEKVKKLITDNLDVADIKLLIKPVALLDDDFDKKIDSYKSKKSKASEIEQSIRHYIRVNLDKDKAYYSGLLEKLEILLKTYNENWDQLAFELNKMREDEKKKYKETSQKLNLSEKEYAFYNLINNIAKKDEIIFDDIEESADPVISLAKYLGTFFESAEAPMGWSNNSQKEKGVRALLNSDMFIRKFFKETKLRQDSINKIIVQAKVHYAKQ